MLFSIVRSVITLVGTLFLFTVSSFAGLKVGVIVPLSGPLAEYGEAVRNSLEMAIDDGNARAYPLTLVYEDVGADPKRAVAAFQKLVTVDRVDLVYVWGVVFCRTVAPLAEMRGILMVGQCVDQKSSAGRKHVVRFMNSAQEYMVALGKELHRREIKRISFVVGENPYFEEMVDAFGKLVEGIETVVIDRVPNDQVDFRTIILQHRSKKVDAVGVFLQGGQTAEFYRQARENRFRPKTFGTNFFENLTEIERSLGAMDGAFFVNNHVNEEFVMRYRARFGNVSQLGFGALAYEFGRLLISVSKGKGVATEAVLEAIREVSNQGVAAGPYDYVENDNDRFVRFPLIVKEIRSGVIVQVGTPN